MGFIARHTHIQPSRHDFEDRADTNSFTSSQTLQPNLRKTKPPILELHQPHSLPEIKEASVSSRATLSKNQSSKFVEAIEPASDHTKEIFQSDADQSQIQEAGLDVTKARRCPIRRPVSGRSLPGSHVASVLSLPLHDIPKRTSSASILSQGRHSSCGVDPKELRPESEAKDDVISFRLHSDSPVRQASNRGAQNSDQFRKSPSHTFVRTVPPFHIFDSNLGVHPRVNMLVRLPSPLFVGGRTIEGQIELNVGMPSSKKAKAAPLMISKLSIDVVGVEEIHDGKRWIFLALATELFDKTHPPPPTLVVSQKPEKGPELCWKTKPSTSKIPFCVNLPLKIGPPPFSSRQASIRYLLCPSISIKVGDARFVIRQMWSIQILTIHNPEKALSSLPQPLLAEDILVLSHKPVIKSVKLTAGLHRQTWVTGGVIFTDVYVVNRTDKALKQIELQLEKAVLWFSYTAAASGSQQASNLRLPKKIDTEIVGKALITRCEEWNGIHAQSTETRTCEIQIPRGHVTIGGGRYFEVRYFLKVIVAVGRRKVVAVKLPVSIIHMNSLDILPNSLAQVVASIDAKRARSKSTPQVRNYTPRTLHAQGQAFPLPRQLSFERAKRELDTSRFGNIQSLMRDIDKLPRRASVEMLGRNSQDTTVNLAGSSENIQPQLLSCRRHLSPRPSCYHCHLLHAEQAINKSLRTGPQLPRLQVSTSGLGFSESDFEIPPDSPPRKVMLSEHERRLINQQRELRLQRQWSNRTYQKSRSRSQPEVTGAGFVAWNNVALPDKSNRHQPYAMQKSQQAPRRRLSQRSGKGHQSRQGSHSSDFASRNRSKTNPERLFYPFSADSTSRPYLDRRLSGAPSIIDHGYRAPRSSLHRATPRGAGDDRVLGEHRRTRSRPSHQG